MQRHRISGKQNAVARACARWFRRIVKNHAQCSEWTALPAGERRLLSADIGACQAEVDWAVRKNCGSRELTALLARPALRNISVSPAVLRDMQRVCASCNSHDRCRNWQAHAGLIARWPAFCPNGFTFASLWRAGRQYRVASWPHH